MLEPVRKALATFEKHLPRIPSSLAFTAHQRPSGRSQRPISGGPSQSARLPERDQLHHHGLPDRRPNSIRDHFMNSTRNVEEPQKKACPDRGKPLVILAEREGFEPSLFFIFQRVTLKTHNITTTDERGAGSSNLNP